MLTEPNPTPWDLRWRMLGTNISVHPFFWVMSAMLGWVWFKEGNFQLLLLWVACVFVSILVHEFGHVLMGRWFGSQDQYIILYSFGGLAVGIQCPQTLPAHPGNVCRSRRSVVAFGHRGSRRLRAILDRRAMETLARRRQMRLLAITLFMLWEINLFWPILNLLPIWPLDGGQIAREFSQMMWREQGTSYALVLSGVLSAVLALHCFMGEKGRPIISLFVEYWDRRLLPSNLLRPVRRPELPGTASRKRPSSLARRRPLAVGITLHPLTSSASSRRSPLLRARP